jgi:hypothetical protein
MFPELNTAIGRGHHCWSVHLKWLSRARKREKRIE